MDIIAQCRRKHRPVLVAPEWWAEIASEDLARARRVSPTPSDGMDGLGLDPSAVQVGNTVVSL